jgi:VWFA-related protein
MMKNIHRLLCIGVFIFMLAVVTGCGGGSPGANTTGVEGYVYVPADVSGSSLRAAANSAAPLGYTPLASAKVVVKINDLQFEGLTDADGHFLIQTPPGMGTVTIIPPAGSPYREIVLPVDVFGNTAVQLGNSGELSLINNKANTLNVIVNQIDLSQWPAVKVYFSVIDPVSSLPVLGFTTPNFQFKVNDKDVVCNIVQTNTTNTPISVCLVLDKSGSMIGPPIADLQTAAKSFVNYSNNADECAILSFDSTVPTSITFTNVKSDLITTIDNLVAGGNTALWDAVYKGVNDTSVRPKQRKAVIAMTDGQENHSVTYKNKDSLIAAIQPKNVPVYTVGLGTIINSADLQSVADSTGGEFFNAPTSSELETIYNKLVIRTQQQYRLSFTIPDASGNPYNLQIKINISGIEGTGTNTITP